jgi:hypothetical protein
MTDRAGNRKTVIKINPRRSLFFVRVGFVFLSEDSIDYLLDENTVTGQYELSAGG